MWISSFPQRVFNTTTGNCSSNVVESSRNSCTNVFHSLRFPRYARYVTDVHSTASFSNWRTCQSEKRWTDEHCRTNETSQICGPLEVRDTFNILQQNFTIFECFRFQSGRNGRLYLHTDIKLLISRRTEFDTAQAHAKNSLESPNDLKTIMITPDPKFSSRVDKI